MHEWVSPAEEHSVRYAVYLVIRVAHAKVLLFSQRGV